MTSILRRAWLAALLLAVTGCSKACSCEAGAEEPDPCEHCTKDQFCTGENRCAPLGRLGEPCEMAEHCIDHGAICRSGKCALQPKLGEACESTSECADGVCRSGKCVPLPKLGEACDFQSECADRDALCKASRCTARPKAGEPCDEDGECVAGTHCGTDKKCHAFGEAGESCAVARCKEGLRCLAAGGTGPEVCHASAAIGEACILAPSHAPDGIPFHNCARGFCQGKGAKGTCVAARRAGEPCDGSWQCEDGFACNERRCERSSSGGSGFGRPHPF